MMHGLVGAIARSHRCGRNGKGRRALGFTLIELVVVLAILSILIALAVPRYMAARRGAYKPEAENLLEEVRTMEWAYYQQYNVFDTSGTSILVATPGGMHWASPVFSGTNTASVQILVSGCGSCSPINTADSLSVVLYSDGSSAAGSSF